MTRTLQPLRRSSGVPGDHVVTGDRRYCPRCRATFGIYKTACLEYGRDGQLLGIAFHCHGSRRRPWELPAERLAEILAGTE